jgi:hypothetical protein
MTGRSYGARLGGTFHGAALVCSTPNTEKLKVNRFVFGLNGSLRARVRILMPQTLHDVVQKALIAEEELISGGQTGLQRDPQGRVHRGHRDLRHQ